MTIPMERIENQILTIRGYRVMLDADLAVLYGVTTGALNQAVKRNAERFPGDFMFRLTAEEGAYLKSQIVISNQRCHYAGVRTDARGDVIGSGTRQAPGFS